MPFTKSLAACLLIIGAASFFFQCTHNSQKGGDGMVNDKKLSIYNVQISKNIDTLLLKRLLGAPSCDTATCYQLIEERGQDKLACSLNNCSEDTENITTLTSIITMENGDTITPVPPTHLNPITVGGQGNATFTLPGSINTDSISSIQITISWNEGIRPGGSYTLTLTEPCSE
ncbi:MAG: hypothetical protein H6573_12295 [Lewinellaceae bacterium]|nr:hypothetical protein [Phaeodactylibacter sp.]MCB9348271.1 hypothetical protein [Lewinellaceae bacterium]